MPDNARHGDFPIILHFSPARGDTAMRRKKTLVGAALIAASSIANAQTVTTQETITRSVAITKPIYPDGDGNCVSTRPCCRSSYRRIDETKKLSLGANVLK